MTSNAERRQSGLWSRNPDTGFYEQVAAAPKAQITGNFYNAPHVNPAGPYSYYRPPASASQDTGKRSLSDRTASLTDAANAVLRGSSGKQRSNTLDADNHDGVTAPALGTFDHDIRDATADNLAPRQKPLKIDPDYVPSNVRTKPWSPDPASSPTPAAPVNKPNYSSRARQTSNASNISELVRRGSVPDRSPLQSLETWSKEEKRAKLELAEHKARQISMASRRGDPGLETQGTMRSEKGRVVSDGETQRPSKSERPRNTSDGQAEDAARRFHHARDALLRENISPAQQDTDQMQDFPVANQSKTYDRRTSSNRRSIEGEQRRGSTELGKYRAKNAGYAGAEAAAMQGPTIADTSRDRAAAERGKAAHDRRRSQRDSEAVKSSLSPTVPDGSQNLSSGDSTNVQKQSYRVDEHFTRNQLQADRMGGLDGSKKERRAAEAHTPADTIPRSSAKMPHPEDGVRYAMPPQTANARLAREQVGFATSASGHGQQDHEKQDRGFRDLFHRGHDHRGYQASNLPLEDWRQAKPVVLTAEDIELEQAEAGASLEAKDSPWWEKKRRSSSSGSRRASEMLQVDGPYEEQANGFRPRLFLKCGPLLRYTGIRKQTIRNTRTNAVTEREVWKGTVMIVTEDGQSDCSTPPMLRLFAQPMDLHQPPPQDLVDAGHELAPENEDPVAGQVKPSRTGRALYVRPVHDIDGGIDLSREENNQGLYSAHRTPMLGPQNSVGPDGRVTPHITFQDKSRIKKRDGERIGRYRDTRAVRLHTERGFTFWRFSIEIELASRETRVAYRINKGPAIGFWVPARGQSMNIMFHSCNGFSLSVDSNNFSGPDPLWRDVLNRHQERPFHVMIGGGDQVYNDAAMRDTELFKEWLQTKNSQHKQEADFSIEMQTELEEFYLNRYAMWFSQGLFSMANSQIPMVNIWDDHDIIDGYGSYPHHFQSTRVFTGLGAVAFKYYMLFQHQSVSAETEKEEPCWLLGKSPGPYINERSRSLFMSLGRHVAFLGLDCRTERMRDEVLSQETYDVIFDRCRAELVKGETKHLIVLLGVPIAYPRLNFLENILTSRVMDPVKAIGRTGMLGGFVNKFDGGVEILDDLDDHWTAKHHKAERNWFIQELQELAAEKSVRITILGGDVHLGAIGQFFSNPNLGIPKDKDHRYMPNVISSAIVNTPPPTMMADVLNKRNKVHHLDSETDENMIPMFSHDVDGSRRNNNHLLPRRNFAVIREYIPGSTPPPTPRLEPRQPATFMPPQFDGADEQGRSRAQDRRYPPGSMKRTMSLTRGPMKLVRRLSGSKKSTPPISLPLEHTRPYNEHERKSNSIQRANSLSATESLPRDVPGEMEGRPTFRRRPTNFSEKDARRLSVAAAKRTGGLDGAADETQDIGHIDLEGGLDISLCMEVDQRNPAGTTTSYRLLVPALWYEGTPDVNTARFSSHRKSLMDRLRFNRRREEHVDGAHDQLSDASRTPSPSPTERFDPATEKNTAFNANPNNRAAQPADILGLSNTGRGAYTASSQPQGMSNYQNGGDAPKRNPVNHRGIQPNPNKVDAFSQGYSLSGPPIGVAQLAPRPLPQPANQYPQSGYRRAAAPAPAPAATGNKGPYGRSPPAAVGYDGYDSEGSEEYKHAPPPQRNDSKDEQFLGIGNRKQSMDGGRPWTAKMSMDGGRPTAGDLGRAESQRKRWQVWK